jgi:hypothetical protein
MATHRSTDPRERVGAGPVMPRTTAGLLPAELPAAAATGRRMPRPLPPRDPAVPFRKDGLGDTGDIYERSDDDGDGDAPRG